MIRAALLLAVLALAACGADGPPRPPEATGQP
jgi:predicted small lipoprotein YifL